MTDVSNLMCFTIITGLANPNSISVSPFLCQVAIVIRYDNALIPADFHERKISKKKRTICIYFDH